MTGPERHRARSVRKMVAFTDSEWVRVERRMALSGARSFGQFARDALLDGEIRVVKVAFDPASLRVELSRIGNNMNQIARQANVDEVATVEQVKAARELLREIQGLIVQASKEA